MMSMICHHHLRLGVQLVSRAALVPVAVPQLAIIPKAFVSKYSTATTTATTTTTAATYGGSSIATRRIPPPAEPHQHQRTAVNAPASTLPPPLSLPSRDGDSETSKLTY